MTSLTTKPVQEVPWEFRVQSDGRIQRFAAEAATHGLQPGEVRLDFLAGGICGSDIGALSDLAEEGTEYEAPIVPMHEVVGRVIESADDRYTPGLTVVGTCLTGLASTLTERSDHVIPIPPSLGLTDAIAIQPISTVLRAARTLPPVEGQDVVVLGTGPIGLAFIHVLARSAARRVIAVDRVEGREALAGQYGADEFFGCTAERWSEEIASTRIRPSLVIDAVGRRPEIIAGALRAVADDGFVLGFGSAHRAEYHIPYSEMYHRRLTLASGRTRGNWRDVLRGGARYLTKHQSDFKEYVNARFPLDDAQAAYRLCSEPDAERVKVALVRAA